MWPRVYSLSLKPPNVPFPPQEEKARKEEEEAKKKADDDARKKLILSNLSFTGYKVMISIKNRPKQTAPQRVASCAAGAARNQEANGERKEEEGLKRSPQGAERGSPARGQAQVNGVNESPTCQVPTNTAAHPPACTGLGRKRRSCGTGCGSWRQRNTNFSTST